METSTALSYLRRETHIAVVARSPRALDSALGWNELCSLVVGDDALLSDLDALARAGIDVERPFGWAALDLRTHTFAVFATVADRDALSAVLRERAAARNTPLAETAAGSATIYLPKGDDEHAAVLRGDQLFLLSSAGARSVRDLSAVRVATTDQSDSLAEDLSFRHGAGHLGFGRDVAGVVALDRVAVAMVEAGDPTADKIAAAARAIQARLDAARKQRARSADLRALKQQADWVGALQRANQSRTRLWTEVAAPLGSVAFGIELEPDGVRVKLISTPSERSLPGELLLSSAEPTRMFDRFAAHPLIAAALRGPRRAVLELVDLWLGTRGVDAAGLAKRVGLDFERDIAPLLTGEIGLAITSDAAAESDLESLRAGLDVDLTLGLKDPARMEKVLSELAARPDLEKTVDRTSGAPRLELSWPGFKPLHVGLAGATLLSTTDTTLFDRVPGRSKEGAFVDALQNPALRKLLSEQRSPLVVLLDGAVLPGLLGSDAAPVKPRIAIALPAPDAATPAQAELAERIARLDAEIEEMRARQRGERLERQVALGRRLGTFAFLAQPRDGSLVVFGGQFPRQAGLRAAFAELVRQKRKNDARAGAARRALDQLTERRNALEKERSHTRVHNADDPTR